MARKKTHEEFLIDVNRIAGEEYRVIGTYDNAHSKLSFFHTTCGNSFSMQPYSFINGRRCPRCYGTPLKTSAEFNREVMELVGREYAVLGEYVTALTKIVFRHTVCGYEFKMKPAKFLQGQRCSRCAGKERKTPERFRQEVSEIVGDEYRVIGDYKRAVSDVLFSHTKCNREFKMQPHVFLRGARCPHCASEQTQSKLASFLKKYFMETYHAEEEWAECVNPLTGRYLPYDIYIPSCRMYVEIQGLQHYRYTELWHRTEENFKYMQYKDKLKKKHAKKNGIYIEIDVRKHDFQSAVELIESYIV